jgi:hypothetical protein
MGDNAIHKLGGLLTTLAAYEPRRVDIDGCEYREGCRPSESTAASRAMSSPTRCTSM